MDSIAEIWFILLLVAFLIFFWDTFRNRDKEETKQVQPPIKAQKTTKPNQPYTKTVTPNPRKAETSVIRSLPPENISNREQPQPQGCVEKKYDCWKCGGKGFLRWTSMHGSKLQKECTNCLGSGEVTKEAFDKHHEAKRQAKLEQKRQHERDIQKRLDKEHSELALEMTKRYAEGENFLRAHPGYREARCHGCGSRLSSQVHLRCESCGWLRCHCNRCAPNCNWEEKAYRINLQSVKRSNEINHKYQ